MTPSKPHKTNGENYGYRCKGKFGYFKPKRPKNENMPPIKEVALKSPHEMYITRRPTTKNTPEFLLRFQSGRTCNVSCRISLWLMTRPSISNLLAHCEKMLISHKSVLYQEVMAVFSSYAQKWMCGSGWWCGLIGKGTNTVEELDIEFVLKIVSIFYPVYYEDLWRRLILNIRN